MIIVDLLDKGQPTSLRTQFYSAPMPRAHVHWPQLPPAYRLRTRAVAPGWGWGGLAGWKMGVLKAGDLSELTGQGPGMPLSDISGASVLKVNRRILRT